MGAVLLIYSRVKSPFDLQRLMDTVDSVSNCGSGAFEKVYILDDQSPYEGAEHWIRRTCREHSWHCWFSDKAIGFETIIDAGTRVAHALGHREVHTVSLGHVFKYEA